MPALTQLAARAATGDIDDMWLRDSSVQMAIYLPRIEQHPALRRIIEGAIRLQAFYITQVLRLAAAGMALELSPSLHAIPCP